MPAIIDGANSARCYAGGVTPAKPPQPTWRKPAAAAVRPGEARRLLPCYLWILASCALVFISPTISSSNALAASDSDWTVEAQPAQLVNGGPVLFQVKPPGKIESLTGSWLGHQFTFSYDASTKSWFALAGINLDTTPGEYSLELTAVRATGQTPSRLTLTRKFAVADGNYPKIPGKLSVEGKFTEPDPEQQKQIEEASKIKKEYLTRVTAERGWEGQFAAPAEADISDVFGIQRVFNGKALSTHYGLDYRVHTGTPVTAMNSGTVLLARFLYYEGNFVVIDHGQGLLTLYLHLSELKVKEGDPVKRGQIVGLSGGTGRATGPHLDVRVRWQGIYLDPARLLQLPLP
jgi:murein DD-endopeptidase MepM/ murein hydrolase activator NlpD